MGLFGGLFGAGKRLQFWGVAAILLLSYQPETTVPKFPGDLPCADVWKMVDWALAHHGYFADTLDTAAFAEKVATRYAEKFNDKKKLEPARVRQLKAALKRDWSAVWNQRSCDWFSEWQMRNHVFSSARPNELLAKALLGGLDKYSTFYNSEEFAELNQELSGEFLGIGVQLVEKGSRLFVEEVQSASPAADKGIRAGDEVVAVNGHPLLTAREEAEKVLRDDAMETFSLRIRRAKEDFDFELTKRPLEISEAKVALKSANYEQSSVAVVSIPQFYGHPGEDGKTSATEDLATALDKIAATPTRAVVLDLRGNPGGYLEEAVSMAGLFLGGAPSVAVVEQARTRVLNDFRENALYQGPLVALVDEETASAGELLVAALKDYRRAVVVGSERTFGKGSVQRLFQLDDPFLQMGLQLEDGVLRLTTSLFYSPLGHSPANGGVSSDIALRTANAAPAVEKAVVPEIPPVVDQLVLDQLAAGKEGAEAKLDALRSRQRNRRLLEKSDAQLSEAVEIAQDLAEVESQGLNAAF